MRLTSLLYLFIFLLGVTTLYSNIFIVNASECFGRNDANADVCSSHGHCIQDGFCVCYQGYYGEECDEFLPANRPSVDLYGMGQNERSQLQNAQTVSIGPLNETSISQDENVLFSVPGQLHNTFFTDQNRLYAFGSSYAVGLGADADVVQPQFINSTLLHDKYVTHMGSFQHTVVSTSDDELFAWGENSDYQIDTSQEHRSVPVSMNKGEIGTNAITGIACGRYITVLLDETGAVYTMGRNANGNDYHLGIAAVVADGFVSSPTRVDNLDAKIAFSASANQDQAHVITTDNMVYTWGKGQFTGTGRTDSVVSPTPVSMDNIPNTSVIVGVCDGLEHGMLLSDGGNVYSFGLTFQGSMGLGDTFYAEIPTKITGGSLQNKLVTQISCTRHMSVALDSNGQLHRWGKSVAETLPISDIPILVDLTYNGLSILNQSIIANVQVGQSHILLDAYSIPECFVGSWYFGQECSGRGTCIADDVCECVDDSLFGGPQCQFYVCSGFTANQTDLVCSGHGDCVDSNNCSCSAGYSGDDCELSICFGTVSNDGSVCSGHGNCTSPDVCECEITYVGEECQLPLCFGINSSDATVCSGHGACVDPDTCSCNAQYTGDNCSIPLCSHIPATNSSVCTSRGTCIEPNECSCNDGYAGSNCEYVDCFGTLSNDSNVCSGHGSCAEPDSCSCNNGYDGKECSLSICFDILSNNDTVCSGHGQCSEPDLCHCTDGHGGTECSLSICFGTLSNETDVCSSHGTCTQPDQCVCQEGYSGDNCELNICFNITSDDTSVCNGQGTCTLHDNCECDIGYGGTSCQLIECGGILSNQSSVCSSRGECIEPDQCECIDGYGGNLCNLNICFGVLSNDSSVCSGHGICVDASDCECSGGYFGENCSVSGCFGIIGTNSSVCNSHGNCIGLDECSCDSSFYGEECNIVRCYGVFSNETSVCSSHGDCVDVQTCDCIFDSTNGYYGGENCDRCDLNYEGTNCLTKFCDASITCNGFGECDENNDCNCTRGYTGRLCDSCVNPYSNFPDCIVCNASTTCSSHGTCTEQETCSCFQSEELGFFDGMNCSLCVSGWSSNSCQLYLPSSFQMSNEGSRLWTKFVDPSFNRPTTIDCSHLFSSSAMEKIGETATCKWLNESSIFEVQLTSASTVIPGEQLDVFRTPGSSSEVVGVSVLSPSDPITPAAVLEAPSVVGLCTDLVLDSSDSADSFFRPMQYNFSSNQQTLDDILPQESGQDFVVISSSQLGTLLTANFSVTVSNFFRKSAFSSVEVQRVELSAPKAYVLGPTSILTTPLDAFFISGYALSSCSGLSIGPSEANFNWTQLSGPFVSDSSLEYGDRRINFANGLPSVGQYEFEFSVTLESFPIPSTKTVTVVARYDDLVPIIQGGNQVIPTDRVNVLDASASYDPNSGFTPENYTYNYQWSCFDITSQSDCNFTIDNEAIVSIPSNTLENSHTYEFTLNYSTADRQETTSVQWTAREGIQVVAYIKSIAALIPSSKSVSLSAVVEVKRSGSEYTRVDSSDESVQYTWYYQIGSQSERLLANEDAEIDTNSVTVFRSILTPGESIKFRVHVEVSDLEESTSATLSTNINTPPTPGTLRVSPSSGQSLDTVFRATTSGWAHEKSSLQYRFYYMHPRTMSVVTLTQTSPQSKTDDFSFPVFSFTEDVDVSVSVQVFDSVGDSSILTQNVTISPSDLTRNQTLTIAEKDIHNTEAITDFASLNSLLQQLLQISQNLVSHEALFCSSSCSNQGICIFQTPYFQSCECEDTFGGKDCSVDTSVKSRAENVKDQSLELIRNIVQDDRHNDEWSETNVDLLSEIMATLSYDTDEVSLDFAHSSYSLLNTVLTTHESFFDLNSIQRIMRSLSNVDGSSSWQSVSCQGRNLTNTLAQMRTVYERTVSVAASHLTSAEPKILFEYSNAIFFIWQQSWTNLAEQRMEASYTRGSERYRKPVSLGLPSSIGMDNSSAEVSLQILSRSISPFLCSRPETSEMQSHVVMVLFTDNSQQTMAVQNLEEPINITVPGNYSADIEGYIWVCRYFDTESSEWSREGCTLFTVQEDSALCQCNHTTYYSVFLEPRASTNTAPSEASELWILPVVLALLLLVCTCCTCCCCMVLCLCVIVLQRRHIHRSKSVQPTELDRKLSFTSIKSNMSWSPWDHEARGLPYYMRKYGTSEHSGSDSDVDVNTDKSVPDKPDQAIRVDVKSNLRHDSAVSVTSDVANPHPPNSSKDSIDDDQNDSERNDT